MEKFKTIYKGLIIGGTMLVPGVSGGSMAMILGIYNKLITSVSSFFKDIKRNTIFLFLFAISAGLGMLIFAKPLLVSIENYTVPMMYFFMGAVAGGVPMMYKCAGIKRISFSSVAYVLLGVTLVLLLACAPENLFVGAGDFRIIKLIIQVLAGIIAAVALILPGISVSYMLLVMGLYDSTVEAISMLDIFFLLPMGIGLIIGIVSTTKILEKAMTKFPRETYLIILGFILGSITQVFPGLPKGYEWVICAVLVVAGYTAIKFISKEE